MGVLTTHDIIKIKTIFQTGVRIMKKNFNVKTIKNELKMMYGRVMDDNLPETTDDYIKLFNSIRMMHDMGFLTWDEWKKIYEYDTELFENNY